MLTVLPAYLTNPNAFEYIDLLLPLATLAAYIAVALIWPGVIMRPVWWLVTHTVYRLRVYNRERIPRTGPVLLVCNHVSYIDWMLIWVACPRKVRFVAWAGWSRNPMLRLFMRVTRSIPVDGTAGPKAIVTALRQVSDALDRGEAICIFPEARLTRTGTMLPFHRGFERIIKQAKSAVPIVPICISQLWGSIFSYRGGKVVWKWPHRIPYPATVMVGEPLPKTVKAPVVRLKIQELSADTALRDGDRSMPVHRHFVRVAARFRQMFRPCLIDTSTPKPRVLNYLKSLVGAILISRWLRPRIGQQANVGIWLPSSVGGALANIALSLLRRTSVDLNYTSGIDAIRSAIAQTKLDVIITSKRFLARMPLDAGPNVQIIHLEDAAGGITKWQRIRTLLTVLLLPGWIIDRWVLGLGKHSLQDIATIIFSSGSTGEPKGVMLTHRNISANSESIVAMIDVTRADRVLGVLPFFHSFGYTVTLWVPLAIGASTVYHADPRQAKEVGELCRTFRCTVLLSTATFLRFYLRRCEAGDFHTMRLIVCGAEKLPPGLAKEFEAKFGVLPLEGYGCTELSPGAAFNVPDQEIAGTHQVGNKLGTVGHPVPGLAFRIIDPETGEKQPPGGEGLIWAKGANVMLGYLGKPEQTAKVVVDGWYNTGDMGKIDDDGFLTLTGRLSRFAKIGGEMVPLEKIEEDLHAVLGTADRVLAVASVPDEKKGERLIVLHLPTMAMTVDTLTTGLSERGLPNLWVPSDRDFHVVDEMPVLGTGKLDLRRVKELAMEKAGRTPT